MRELALRDGASQRLGDLLLGREVVDGRGAVLLDPELRAAAHGYLCRVGGVLGWRLLTTGAFGAAGMAAAKAAARAGNIWSVGLREQASTNNLSLARKQRAFCVINLFET